MRIGMLWPVTAKTGKTDVFLRKIPSKIANAIIRRMTGVYITRLWLYFESFQAGNSERLGNLWRDAPFYPSTCQTTGRQYYAGGRKTSPQDTRQIKIWHQPNV